MVMPYSEKLPHKRKGMHRRMRWLWRGQGSAPGGAGSGGIGLAALAPASQRVERTARGAAQAFSQRILQAFAQQRCAKFVALAEDAQRVVVEVHVLNPQPAALGHAQSAAVDGLGHQAKCAVHLREEPPDLFDREHFRQPLAPFGADRAAEIADVQAEDIPAQHQQRGERLILGARGDLAIRGQVGNKIADGFPRNDRLPLDRRACFPQVVEETPGPVQIGLLGAVGVMPHAQHVPERGEGILGDHGAVGREHRFRRGRGFIRALSPAQPGGNGLSGLLDLPFLSAVPFQRVEKTRQRLIGRCVIHDGGAAQEPAHPTDVKTGVLLVRDPAPEQVRTEGRQQRVSLSIAHGETPPYILNTKKGGGGTQWAIFSDVGVRRAVPRRKRERLTENTLADKKEVTGMKRCFCLYLLGMAGALLTIPARASTILAETDFGTVEGTNISPFFSDYRPGLSYPPCPGQYDVSVTAAGHGPGDWGGVDHTTGTGCFMLIDGATDAAKAIVLYSNETWLGWVYTFHGWVQNVIASGGGPPVLSFRVNGVEVGTFSPVGGRVWNEFAFRYTNVTSGAKSFAIHDNNTGTGANDFGLDDLALYADPGPASAWFLAVSTTNGYPVLSITNSLPARTAWVQRCVNLLETNWVSVYANAVAYTNWTDASAGTSWTNLFYRLGMTGEAEEPRAPTNMVYIPAGSFQMGNCMDPGEGDEIELPVHSVYVSSFFMDKYEVTKALWDEVYTWSETNGYSFSFGDIPPEGKAPNHPVVRINWWDAVKWCNARSEREGLTPCYYLDDAHTLVYRSGNIDLSNSWVNWTANGYRLPTEAEWEKAARGGAAGHRFPWTDSDDVTHDRGNYLSTTNYTYDVSSSRGYHPGYDDLPQPFTSPVGTFPPNGYGLYDMFGNVWEWCWDRKDSAWYSNPLATEADTPGPASGYGRHIRGTSWSEDAAYGRVSARFGSNVTYSEYKNFGFRCVRR